MTDRNIEEEGVGPKTRRYLLVRLDHVGDCVMTVPAVARAIKEAEPDCLLDLLTTARNRELLAADPHIDRFHVYDSPWSVRPAGCSRTPRLLYVRRLLSLLIRSLNPGAIGRYDAVFYLSYAAWERLLTVPLSKRRLGFQGPYQGVLQRLAKKTLTVSVPFDEGRHVLANDYTLVGLCVPLVSTPFDSRVVLTDKDREYGRRQLGASGVADEAPIAMHPGGGTFRSWQAERFGALANRLADHCGCSVVVMSGPGEEDVAETVRSAAKHERVRVLITEDYYAFQVAVSHARAFIGNDTGPTHIAAACGVPTVAVFGSTSSTIFAPPGPHVRVVERKQPCTPCRVPWREPETCMRDRECLLAVDVDTVFDAVKALLDQETGSPE